MKNPFSLPRKSTFGLFLIVFFLFFSQVIWNGTFLGPNTAQAQGLEQALAASQNNPQVRAAMAAQEKHSDRIMGIPDVVGHGIGSYPDGTPNITIFATRAGAPGIPATIEGVPTEVKVTGMIVAYVDPTARFRPVPIGVSTGHPDITAGTIGCRVTGDLDSDGIPELYALSNNHVYANSNDASINDYVIQPGTFDGGTDPETSLVDVIGTLYDFEPIDFNGGDNTIDAAIAEPLIGIQLLCSTPGTPEVDGYGTPSSTTAIAKLGQLVQKYGRTTGWTHGEVSAIYATVDVCYETRTRGPFLMCVKSARFVDQIIITPGSFSDGGDSGSLIVTDDVNKNPVGLLFAGSDTHTIANPIDAVLTRFGVTVDDCSGACTPSPEVCNGVDDDCDGSVDEGFDSDEDGYTTCGGDCNDNDASIYPGAEEFICNGVDNDCDGFIDENYVSYSCGVGACQAESFCTGGIEDCQEGYPTAEVCYDGEDNDCDGSVDCDDSDCESDTACSCDPSPEVCDGLDNDCDDQIDEDGVCDSCLVIGSNCSSDSDCCSLKCRGKPGSKTCR